MVWPYLTNEGLKYYWKMCYTDHHLEEENGNLLEDTSPLWKMETTTDYCGNWRWHTHEG
jgi:hypothetical protein